MQALRKSNSVLLALLTAGSLAGGSIEAGGSPPEIPLRIPPPEKTRTTTESSAAELPAWVSARAIHSESGSLVNWDLIPSHYRRSYETANQERLKEIESARSAGKVEKAAELAKCPETPTKFFRSNHGRRNQNLTDLTLSAEAIYRGTIRARDAGFIEGRVGSLLFVEIDETLKAPGERPVVKQLFVEYPFADFQIGDMLFCLRPDRTPAVPEEGDSILVFVLFPPTDRGLVVGSRSEEILFESSAGALSLPTSLRGDLPSQRLKTLADAEERIARARDKKTSLPTSWAIIWDSMISHPVAN